MRRTNLILLVCSSVAMAGGCTDAPQTRGEVVQKTCRQLSLIAEPYSQTADTPPFGLLRPTNSPDQWREDGEAMKDAAKHLEGLDLRVDLAGRWVAVSRYLIATSSNPEAYDTAAVEKTLWLAESLCSSMVEETV